MVAAGISETTAQETARTAFIEAAKIALTGEDGIDIGRGFRWPIIGNDWVYAAETESDINPETLGPRRAIDERITIHVSIGAWVPGETQETEDAAYARAFYIYGLIVKYLNTGTNTTLGGVVFWCLPGSSISAGATADNDSMEGRLTEIAATFVCRHRIQPAP